MNDLTTEQMLEIITNKNSNHFKMTDGNWWNCELTIGIDNDSSVVLVLSEQATYNEVRDYSFICSVSCKTLDVAVKCLYKELFGDLK